MPNIEYNYTDQQLDIIDGGQNVNNNLFQEGTGDYVRLTILNQNGSYAGYQFFSPDDIKLSFDTPEEVNPKISFNFSELKFHNSLSGVVK